MESFVLVQYFFNKKKEHVKAGIIYGKEPVSAIENGINQTKGTLLSDASNKKYYNALFIKRNQL